MATILVIDDDQAMRRLLVNALTAQNHAVIEAADGRQGVELAARHNPALVITDILMPEKEGIETMRELREHAPSVKIVAISGGGLSHNMLFLDLAKALGADATLAKPFRPADLVKTVEDLLLAAELEHKQTAN
jgi:CheY-like chemotaxis protein